MLQKFLLTVALVGGALPALAQSQQQGTPQDRAACAPAVRKFCKSANEDTMRVLACLQANRAKIGAARPKQGQISGLSAANVVGFQVTQIPITCAQIATILKNSASEASVANSSTMVRHMSLTPTRVQESNVFPCFGLTLEGSRFIGRAGNGNVQLRAEH